MESSKLISQLANSSGVVFEALDSLVEYLARLDRYGDDGY